LAFAFEPLTFEWDTSGWDTANNDDGFNPYWTDERDWLVEVVLLPKDDPEHTNTRMLAVVGDPTLPTYELWFSFAGDTQKQAFLQMVRDDGYADPDEEGCFDPPETLNDLADLRPIALVFPQNQRDHISALAVATMSSMGIEPREIS